MKERSTEILQAIQDHLGARGLDVSKIKPEAELLRDLDLDSLDTVELTLGLENRFGIEIPDDDLADLVTIDDAITLISSKLTASV